MSEFEAVKYIERILVPGDIMPIKTMLSRLDRAPPDAKRYFNRYCKNARELETFLRDKSEYFYLENKKVLLFEEGITEVQKMAEEYFKKKVLESSEALHFMDLKDRYIDGAKEEVISFIARIYPASEFKKFFKYKPHIFVLQDDKVFLIEIECVKFLKRKIKCYGAGSCSTVQGYVSRAPKHVHTYLNTHWWGADFKFFFKEHSDIFNVDNSDYITLVNSNNGCS